MIFNFFFTHFCMALMFYSEYISLYYQINFFQESSDEYKIFYKGFHEKYLILSDKTGKTHLQQHVKNI